MMINFLSAHWGDVVALIAVIGAVILSGASLRNKIKALAYFFVIKAEAYFGSGSGAFKKHAVYLWVREKLPAALRPFATDRVLDAAVEKAVALMKKWLADNPEVDVSAFKFD